MIDLDLCLEVVQGHVNHCGIIAPKLLEPKTSNLVSGFVWGMLSGRTKIIFHESGRGLAHVTPTIFGVRIFKTTWASDFKFGTRLCNCMGNAEMAHK